MVLVVVVILVEVDVAVVPEEEAREAKEKELKEEGKEDRKCRLGYCSPCRELTREQRTTSILLWRQHSIAQALMTTTRL